MTADRLQIVLAGLLLVAQVLGTEVVAAQPAQPDQPVASRMLRHDPFSRSAIRQVVQSAPNDAARLVGPTTAGELGQATAAGSVQTVGVVSSTAAPSNPVVTAPPPVLRALLRSGSRPMANVDGQLLEIGDSINGLRLIEIGEYTATFLKGRKRVELALGGAALR